MRIRIRVEQASTGQVRDLAAALDGIGLTGMLTVGLDGPELWSASTPMLTTQQHAIVVARLVKFRGTPIAGVLAVRVESSS